MGRRPEQFGRLWVHTHPGNFAEPSMTDEETFARVFGRTDWAVMFILARGGQSYARLRFHVGPGGDVDLPVRVDYSRPFAASDHAAWRAEYLAAVQVVAPLPLFGPHRSERPGSAAASLDPWDDEFSAWDNLFEREETGFAEAKEPSHGDLNQTVSIGKRTSVPQNRLAEIRATVIGVGAIGRQVAMDLRRHRRPAIADRRISMSSI